MKYGEIYYTLDQKVIVDTSRFKNLETDKMNEIFIEIHSKNVPVQFVENTFYLFDKEKLIKDLIDGKDCKDSLAIQDIKLSIDDLIIIKKFNNIIKEIRNNSTVVSTHKFEEVPSNYKCQYNFSDKFIRNSNKTQSISISKAEKIWLGAKNIWIDYYNKEHSLKSGIRIPNFCIERQYSTYSVEVYPKEIKIGCQTISKLDLEQIAIHYGWDLT